MAGIPTGGSTTSGNTIKVDITANVESAVPKSNVEPGKSLKSLRTYQVGVVYKDIYGRETPVLTNEEATFTVQKELSNKATDDVLLTSTVYSKLDEILKFVQKVNLKLGNKII